MVRTLPYGPVVTASPDGALAAVLDGDRLVLLDLTRREEIAEASLPDLDGAHQVAFLGGGARLLAVLREPTQTTLLGFSVPGLQPVAKLELPLPMQPIAFVGDRAFLASDDGDNTKLVLLTPKVLVADLMAVRGPVRVATAAPEERLLVESRGQLEFWDPMLRRALFRLNLPLPPNPKAIGFAGKGRLLWVAGAGLEGRFEVFRFSDGRPQLQVDLGGRILAAAGSPTTNRVMVALAGSEAAPLEILALDLGARERRVVDWAQPVSSFALVEGEQPTLVLVGPGAPVGYVALNKATGSRAVPLGAPTAATIDEPPAAAPSTEAAPTVAPSRPSTAPAQPGSAAERFAAWRSRLQATREGPAPESEGPSPEAAPERVDEGAEVGAADPLAAATARLAQGGPSPRRPPFPRPPISARPGTAPVMPSPPRPAPAAPRPAPPRGQAPAAPPPARPASPPRLGRPVVAEGSSVGAPPSRPSLTAPSAPPRPNPAPRPASPPTALAAPAVDGDDWRRGLVSWLLGARTSGGATPPPLDGAAPLTEVIEGFAIEPTGARILALLYGLWLLGEGEAGAATEELARLGGDGDWREALGHGGLAAAGLVRAHRGRLRLLPAVGGYLDGAAPRARAFVPARRRRRELVQGPTLWLPLEGAVVAQLGELAERLGEPVALVDLAPKPRLARLADGLFEAQIQGALPILVGLGRVSDLDEGSRWLEALGGHRCLVAVRGRRPDWLAEFPTLSDEEGEAEGEGEA